MRTATRTEPPQPGGRTSARGAALWVLQVITAAGFVAAASSKFTGADQIETVFAAMGAGDGLMYAVGVLEVAGAVGLLIPRLCGLAAAAFVVLMIGALATHAVVGGTAIPAAVMLCLAALVAWLRWKETMALVLWLARGSRAAPDGGSDTALQAGHDA